MNERVVTNKIHSGRVRLSDDAPALSAWSLPYSSGFYFTQRTPAHSKMQHMKKNSCCLRVTTLTGVARTLLFYFRSKESCEKTKKKQKNKDCFCAYFHSSSETMHLTSN